MTHIVGMDFGTMPQCLKLTSLRNIKVTREQLSLVPLMQLVQSDLHLLEMRWI
jgi:hypothetical protein